MATTIQISQELKHELLDRKIVENESYEEVIWDMLEDVMELSEETKRSITKAEREIKEGKTVPFEEIKKRIGS